MLENSHQAQFNTSTLSIYCFAKLSIHKIAAFKCLLVVRLSVLLNTLWVTLFRCCSFDESHRFSISSNQYKNLTYRIHSTTANISFILYKLDMDKQLRISINISNNLSTDLSFPIFGRTTHIPIYTWGAGDTQCK